MLTILSFYIWIKTGYYSECLFCVLWKEKKKSTVIIIEIGKLNKKLLIETKNYYILKQNFFDFLKM